MTKRNLYLKTKPVEEALEQYLNALSAQNALNPKPEFIDTYDSLGRITASPVFAKCCSPLFNAAAMDGIAVISEHTKWASDARPIELRRGKDYQVIDTGDPIKSPFDAVIMAEDVQEIDEDTVRIIEPAPIWQHVRPIGEDIVSGEMLIPTGHKIRPADIGALLAGGILRTEVWKKPVVSIIPTGTEIIEPKDDPQEGDIIDANSGMFAAMVTEAGGLPIRGQIISDDYEQIKAGILHALDESDMVIVGAGSSAGTEDYTVHILREIGEVIVHGVAMKPGKPVILAIVHGKPVIGLPGYPVSAYLAFENFAEPVIAACSGTKPAAPSRKLETAVISRRMVSSLKHREYVRVKAGKVGDKLVAAPLSRGAGAAMSLVRADGFCIIPQNAEGFDAGEEAEIELLKDLEDIEQTLVSIGSHDMMLDVISDMMAVHFGGMHMSSTHVGSMGGLMALKRGETLIAPTHLLNENDGIYNLSYIENLFPEGEITLIKGLDRIQGFMVAKGNPYGIKGVEQLPGLRYVNRQRGAGTRVLFDYKLKQAGISPDSIKGYDKEAVTHMAVAAQIASGEADVGMGIQAAAVAMGLDFVPVDAEEYDFAIRTENLQLPQVQAFLAVLRSEEFHEKLKTAGGYGWHQSGRLIKC